MGVQGLWELLAPVGRRVSVETLANRKLAIDASIWMVQFMKAMRDDKGEMIRNAHLIGFFRRICKLLFLRVKPVFVFDGGTPALKRRTVIARRRQRENAQTKIRKTAEKLLLNHLRTRRLEDLAQEIQNAKGNRELPGDKKHAHVDIRETHAELGADIPQSSQAASASPNYEAADAILAASLAAEEEGQVERALSHEEIHSDESDDMGDSDQMVLQVMPGKVDPAVLAALPPSMQLDLLVQMREQLMVENRQKFQKVKKAPSSFSQLQIEAYLKTVAFRREIDEVQKAAGGRGVGGMPTSRIASESGREFIFSSSFTGDKQALNFPPSNTDNTEEGRPVAQENVPAASSMLNSSIASFNSVVKHQNESSDVDSDSPVQTYIDEKGQVRVSRVRGMGVRMTRDLQWNLYLMKESEEQAMRKATNNMKAGSGDRDLGGEDIVAVPVGVNQANEHEVEALDVTELRHESESLSNAVTGENEMSLTVDDRFKSDSQCKNIRGLQISFLADEIEEPGEEDDDMFAALVAGQSIPEHTSDDVCRGADTHNHTEDNASECEWEEGQIMATGESETIHGAPLSTSLLNVSEKFPIDGRGISGDSEVEWEDGDIALDNETSFPSTKVEKIGSRGLLSEEAELQEAIRRSLEDLGASRPKGSSSQLVIKGTQQGNFKEDSVVGMPIQVSFHRNYIDIDEDIYIDKVSDKKHGKGFVERERARKGKAVFSEGLENSSEKNNSKLQGPQGLVAADQSESNPKLTITEEILNENLMPSGGSIPAHKKNIEDEHLSALNAMEGSSTVEEFPVEVGLTMLHEMQNNEHHFHSANIGELQNNNEDSALQFPEPRQSARMTVADHGTSIQNFIIDATDEIVSGSGRTFPSSVMQAEATNQHPQEVPEDNLIREAEEFDLSKDWETLTTKEAELLAKKQDSLRKKEEFQAELEAEKEALQAGVDEEMIFLRQEELDLRTAQKKNERNAESVSSEMFAECQELLQMFGLPYIIAPMEAEAQCAFMELVHLVDGVVTDDCDVFLFGARSVYKNIFDDRKYVETYFMKDIEEELGLNRQKLIRMALLLGSDYTEGISGIGIVNAIEVVNAFPEEDGLKDFKGWLDSPDPSILEKVHTHSEKTSRKRSKPNKKTEYQAEEKKGEDIMLDQNTQRGQVDGPSEERNLALKQIFMEKHRTVSKNWHVPDSFPNEAVICAYTAPQVDKSTEPFSWGRPDLLALRKLCWERFGWTKEKADELLLPVLKEYDRHETQLRLEAFYSFSERFAKIRSRRIQKAVTGITGRRSSEIMDLPPHLMSAPLKRSRKNKENGISSGASEDTGNQARADNKSGKLAGEVQGFQGKKDGRRERKNEMDSILVEPGNRAGKVSTGGKGRGRGRAGKARGRGWAGRGRAKRAQSISSADESGSEKENETSEEGQLKRKLFAEPVELRKSTRRRREVKYASDGQESDSVGYIQTDTDKGMLCEESETLVLQKQPQVLSDSFRSKHDGVDVQTQWQPTASEHTGDTGFRDGGPCRDYLATGGGFFFEEDSNVNDLDANKDNVVGNVISNEDNIKCSTSESIPMGLSSQVVSTRNDVEHLHCGGSYCVSEGANRLASGEDLSNNHVKELEFEEGAVCNIQKERNPQLCDSTTEIKPETNNSGSVLGLRTMPFLRRKRRT